MYSDLWLGIFGKLCLPSLITLMLSIVIMFLGRPKVVTEYKFMKKSNKKWPRFSMKFDKAIVWGQNMGEMGVAGNVQIWS